MKEEDRKRRQVMLAIAEHYYLLHDHFKELGLLQPPRGPRPVGVRTV
jgi:hypothetical protein